MTPGRETLVSSRKIPDLKNFLGFDPAKARSCAALRKQSHRLISDLSAAQAAQPLRASQSAAHKPSGFVRAHYLLC
jgi:hypothetical protein